MDVGGLFVVHWFWEDGIPRWDRCGSCALLLLSHRGKICLNTDIPSRYLFGSDVRTSGHVVAKVRVSLPFPSVSSSSFNHIYFAATRAFLRRFGPEFATYDMALSDMCGLAYVGTEHPALS